MRRFLLFAVVTCCCLSVSAQETPASIPAKTSISSAVVLDAAGEEQRQAIKSVYLILCRSDNSAGTGFLLSNGLMVTNAHVVGTCNKDSLEAISPLNEKVVFSQIETDSGRDLALLKPSKALKGGLEIDQTSRDPVPGTTVSTWGYPLLYNGISPLLSVGYVAGFRQDATVKHIVVNGAFNHGNSGGPLLASHSKKVIGVVVSTYHFFPKEIDFAIQRFKKSESGMSTGFTTTDANGATVQLLDMQVVGIILEEFYRKTQVVIGEAISASELRAFLAEKSASLGVQKKKAAHAR